MRSEFENFTKVFQKDRLERMEREINKIKLIEAQLEATSHKVENQVSKSELETVSKRLVQCVTNTEFYQFREDYKEYK